MPEAPVIGITTYRQHAGFRGWSHVMADIVPTEYARAVEESGGAPILLPPIGSPELALAVARRIDGIVVAGGADINPARYGATPVPEVTIWRDDRDASELAYLAAAEELGLPVLGVCRGMQMLAVLAGGVLDQHIPNVLGGSEEHSGLNADYTEIEVRIEPGHRISDLLPESFVVNCHHHQGVADLAGYTPTAYSADGYLHAMEAPGDRFVVGVQWHPESRAQFGVFRGLVDAARERTAALR